ncbi:hypothetical protein QFZ94_008822 [Paraburkholderia sp. JPY465]
MMIDSRTLASWVAALACVTVVCSPVSAAGKGSPAPSAPFDIATAIGDPMSPVNPYNAGTDPITMPGVVDAAHPRVGDPLYAARRSCRSIRKASSPTVR